MNPRATSRPATNETGAADDVAPLSDYEQRAGEAVGRVIEFWGFKRNHGRVWTLLFLRNEGLTAAALIKTLGLSKGAVSMLTKELETWGVIKRGRGADGLLRYSAESELLKMLTHVVRRRESSLVSEVRAELEEAQALLDDARAEPPGEQVHKRMAKLVRLARIADDTVQFLLRHVPSDMNDLARLFSRKKEEDEHKPD